MAIVEPRIARRRRRARGWVKMPEKKLFVVSQVPDYLLASLESRDVALWVHSLPKDPIEPSTLASFLGLPWRLVLTEIGDHAVIDSLDEGENSNDPMTRKRGFIQVIDGDPSRIELPQRSLPIYLLNGRPDGATRSDFEARLRRMTMLEGLRRSGARLILVISGEDDPLPPDLKELWSSGFRAFLTLASDAPDASDTAEDWLQGADCPPADLVSLPASKVVQEILRRYAATYPEDQQVVRVRDGRGTFHKVDVTGLDEPERPILEHFLLLEDRDLTPLTPDELSEQEFVGFFQDPTNSWRPYAAGLPWLRDERCVANLTDILKRLDSAGAEENCIAYISAESGAGGTTLARTLAWGFASKGYPVLVAKPVPFAADALPVVNFLNRVQQAAEVQASPNPSTTVGPNSGSASVKREVHIGRYEAPWIIVFDGLHWQDRDSELVRFRNELAKSGRPVCLLIVAGPIRGLSFFNSRLFRQLAELNHAIDNDDARRLGRHLNRFLQNYGKHRSQQHWDRFYQEHTIRYLDGLSAFWITLSFWIQGQYDLSESIQDWVYRAFQLETNDPDVKESILQIAALSSERLPMAETLLPDASGKWPISQLLEDSRSSLSPLGLVRISANGERHWALVHDILGRFLLNALFYDFATRKEFGLSEAQDPDHLRFLLLRRVSQNRLLGERSYRPMGEDFATSIFKIDPGSGHGSFTSHWREVLSALDNMPRPLRDTSRVFRHHSSISRRRIAKLDGKFYSVTLEDRAGLLSRAIDDINYALTLEHTPGSEPNLNLYNSLANAYFDLSELEIERDAPAERIRQLRAAASDATRRAYEESPTNSFVIETYVKNLLQSARLAPDQAVAQCVEALGIVFSALTSAETLYRSSQLGELGDRALEILLSQPAATSGKFEPSSPIDVLLAAWRALVVGRDSRAGLELSDLPEENLPIALEILGHAAGRGNMQVTRLRYVLASVVDPRDFKVQLELVEQLQATDYRLSPQLRLEYAILLFQNSRPVEGDKVFRALRSLWRDSEHFVQVPERMRWLLSPEGSALQVVQAVTGSDYGNRAMARVLAFGNALVPFRPEEHGIRDLRPGMRFACHVSFGHNGPFLRPVTVGAGRAAIGG